ncbi:hypothetical protein QWM81_14500 [Streptomyces ficellus]|uniref:Integral membrane protein n=1 Tax=Streptomyces ficellus TaxID=1977088 RepID=A0ABT7Z6X2_9ACTN|nr:hypothetical protein [Streptomyces ficellus]MDN3295247.1 hypothetical protein [Streptomyces ficellus]
MAGPEPVDARDAVGTAQDDTLYVLTAVLLTPAQFPSVLGDDYPEACAALGLEPYAEGYGLVLGQDGEGARWTVVVDDVSLVAVAIASWDCGMDYDLSPDEGSVVVALPGWPLALAVAAPQVPAPHDPETAAGEPGPLRPPDPGQWGPAQRRLGADEVALRWMAWREQLGESDFAKPPERDGDGPGRGEGPMRGNGDGRGNGPMREDGSGHGDGSMGGGAPAAAEEERAGNRRGDDRHGRLRRVLAELRGYLEEPPPPGRVRSGFAPGGARTLRADGPGWSLVARTDDMAFVLLDEMPREVLPVGRGPNLPALLAALDAMAVRPA